jgi:uncharacterized GH25 family protein
LCPPLAPHDFWIEPSTYRPAPGSVVTLSLRVGEQFAGDPVPRSAQLIERFVMRDREVIGRENADPAGLVRFERGGYVVYRSKPQPLEIPRAKFEQFLSEEGLPPAKTTEPHREVFHRYAKALLGRTTDFAQPVGSRLELVPLSDPLASTPLRVQVLFEGKPLAGALVTAMHRDDPSKRLTARTPARGTVTLPLTSGIWLIKTVHLVPGKNEPWESLWASLTFER